MNNRSRYGFTLLEILIVISILLLIIFLVMINLRTQLLRANDTKRKADLQKIQKAYEEYFNDKQCYPYKEVLEECGGTSLSPYIKRLPCDPVTKTPYLYVPGAPNLCSGYRVCTKLEDLKDTDIARIGCDPVVGCGFSPGYNYCVSMGYDGNASSGGFDPITTPTPTSMTTPPPGNYACTPAGRCNSYANTVSSGCPVTFADEGCQFNGVSMCDIPSNRCAR